MNPVQTLPSSNNDNDDSGKENSKVPNIPKTIHVTPDAKQALLQLPKMHSVGLNWLAYSRVVSPLEDIHASILEYVKHGQHHGYGMKVQEILRIARNDDAKLCNDQKTQSRFRMLLWHGSKTDKVTSILEKGFQLPLPTNQMFGPGIYFADRASKSANYGDGTQAGQTGYLLLCDVILGKVYNAKGAHNKFTQAPKGFKKDFDSVMCTGKFVPDRAENKNLKGCIIPCGKTIVNTKFSSYAVNFNEYIVYDKDKVIIKFLVKVEFTSSKIV